MESKTYEKNEIIFEEGEPGGDVYVIEEGSVEIFQKKGKIEDTLTTMGKGEVIGLLTCLTKQPRTASAKAAEITKLRTIPFDRLKKAMADLPEWLRIIVKEYNFRLSSLLNMNLEKSVQIAELSHEVINARYDARHICGILSKFSQHFAIEIERERYVLKSEITQAICETLNLEEIKVELILQILSNNGLIKEVLEPDKKRKAFLHKTLVKIDDLPPFIVGAEHGLMRKMASFRFKDKHLKAGRGLVILCRQREMDLNSIVSFECKKLKSELKKATGAEFSLENIDPFIKFKLIDTITNPQNPKKVEIKFVPSNLGRTLALALAYADLAKIDYHEIMKSA